MGVLILIWLNSNPKAPLPGLAWYFDVDVKARPPIAIVTYSLGILIHCIDWTCKHYHVTFLPATYVIMHRTHPAIHYCFGSSRNLRLHLCALYIVYCVEVKQDQTIGTHSCRDS